MPAPSHVAACTIIAKNYLPHARVLAASLARHAPDVERFVLLADRVDGHFDPAAEPFTLVTLDELGIPDLQRVCFQYDLVELSTAAKPYLLSHLLAGGASRVLFFDPDVLVVRTLDPLLALLERASIVLTPHLTAPLEDDGRAPTELDVLRAGVFNLGFLGVAASPATDALLRWWQARLYRHCRVAPDEGMHVDQRWLDLAPGYFDGVHVLRDPGYNVAYWNLPSRALTVAGDDVRVNDAPCYFVHFSGFDPEEPAAVSRHQNRFTGDTLGGAAPLFARYRTLLLDAGFAVTRHWPYAFGAFDNGVPITAAARRRFLRLGDAARRFGDPFAAAPEGSYFRWLGRRSGGTRARAARLRRRLYGRYVQPRVVALKPALKRALGDDPQLWQRLVGLRQRLTDDPSAGPVPRPFPVRADPLLGVNVAGYVASEKGMGEAARAAVRALAAAGVPYVVNDFPDVVGSENRESGATASTHANPHPINLIHVNADQVPAFATAHGAAYFADRVNVGQWNWELADFPADWQPSFAYLDEVWVPSTFTLDAVSRASPLPVVRMPYALALDRVPSPDARARLGWPPERCVFLFVFDLASFSARKNPLGLVRAFADAFTPADDARLVLKCMHAEADPAALAALTDAARGADVEIQSAVVDRAAVVDLMGAADCYVSLHRAEGFGLTLAEAMSLGTPVVATGYSGNCDFMRDGNSLLVRYALAELERDHGPYRRGMTWAEPDLAHAAACMRWVYEHRDEARALGACGRRDVTRELAPAAVGARMAERLRALAR